VTTDFSGYNSSTSVSIYGNVIEDGGGEVSARGIAWGTIYNPTVEDQTQTAGTGTGDFVTTLSGLTEGETYYVRAFATNSAGTAYGNCISFVAESTIGMDVSRSDHLDFQIYPNPAQEHVTLHFVVRNSEGIVFTMFDLGGRIVLQKDLNNIVTGENMINLDISHLENGIYTCRMNGDQNTLAIRNLIVSR
jgi:hypothetical protein